MVTKGMNSAMRKIISVLAFGLVMFLPTTSSAQAAVEGDGFSPAAISDCQPNEVCTFDGINYGIPHYDYNSTTRHCHNIGSAWDNRIGSIVNRSPRQIWAFRGANCWQGGSEVLDGLDSGWAWTAGQRGFSTWNDVISSIDFG